MKVDSVLHFQSISFLGFHYWNTSVAYTRIYAEGNNASPVRPLGEEGAEEGIVWVNK